MPSCATTSLSTRSVIRKTEELIGRCGGVSDGRQTGQFSCCYVSRRRQVFVRGLDEERLKVSGTEVGHGPGVTHCLVSEGLWRSTVYDVGRTEGDDAFFDFESFQNSVDR